MFSTFQIYIYKNVTTLVYNLQYIRRNVEILPEYDLEERHRHWNFFIISSMG